MAEFQSTTDPFVPSKRTGFGSNESKSDPFIPSKSTGFGSSGGFDPAGPGFEDIGKPQGATSTGFKPTEAFSTGFEQTYSVSSADFDAVRRALLDVQAKVSTTLATMDSIAKVNTYSTGNENQEQKGFNPDSSGLSSSGGLTSTGFR